MNKYILLFFLPLLSSCIGQYESDAQSANIREHVYIPKKSSGDTFRISKSGSKIFWKGTKMRGAGKHEGKIHLKEGFVVVHGGNLVSGKFITAMHTIEITDIPKTDPIPIKNLTDHLKSDEFFDVKNYPTSQFEITGIEKLTSDSFKISGNLTLKGITKNIEFSAFHQDKIFITKFTIDRSQWNIAYEGNWADKTFVDKDIELTITIVIE